MEFSLVLVLKTSVENHGPRGAEKNLENPISEDAIFGPRLEPKTYEIRSRMISAQPGVSVM
jgi:hypothetical protein